MKEEKTTALRQRMIEDMRIRAIGETTQKGHIRAVKHLRHFLVARRIRRHWTNSGLINFT